MEAERRSPLGEPWQVLPPLAPEEYDDLRRDIATNGVQVPVVIDEVGTIIDGHHRVRICRELGITDYPRIVLRGLSDDEKIERALALNLHRRHLSRDDRRALVARLRSRGWSTRRIAETTGIPQPTVWRDTQDIDSDESMPDRIETSDGRSYPATRPTLVRREPVDDGWQSDSDDDANVSIDQLPTLPPPPEPTPAERAFDDLWRLIGTFAKADPDDVALVLGNRMMRERVSHNLEPLRQWLETLDASLTGPAVRRIR